MKTFVTVLEHFCTKKRPQIYTLTGGLPKEEKKNRQRVICGLLLVQKIKRWPSKSFQEFYPRRIFKDRRDAGGGSILRTPPPMSRIGLVTFDELNDKPNIFIKILFFNHSLSSKKNAVFEWRPISIRSQRQLSYKVFHSRRQSHQLRVRSHVHSLHP